MMKNLDKMDIKNMPEQGCVFLLRHVVLLKSLGGGKIRPICC